MLASDNIFERVACDEEDPEVFAVSTSEAEGSPKRLSKAKVASVAIGIACLCSVVAYAALAQDSDEENAVAPQHSARALLESKDMADVVTRNYISVWPDLKHSERRLNDEITADMKKITATIKDSEPKVFQQLNELTLSDPQKKNILKVVGSISDKRVQAIGRELAKIAQSSKIAGKRKWSGETLKRQLGEAFDQNKTKLAQLRNEIVPVPLRSMVDASWQMSFDPERMRLVRDSKDSWDVEMGMDTVSSRRLEDISQTNPGSEWKPTEEDMDEYGSKFQAGLGVLSGLLEQARVALDQIDFVGESFDVDMKIPYWAKSLIGGLDFIGELSDCVMRGQSNQVKLMMCPMKYASAATDFLESFDNVLGVSNGHFFGGDTTSPAATGYSFKQQPQYAEYAQQQPQHQQDQQHQQTAPQYAQQQYAPQNVKGLYR